MSITFTNWDEWKDTLAKMQAGLVVCPDCNEWVTDIYKIPSRYKKPLGIFMMFFFDPDSSHQYCCSYCMSRRISEYKKSEYLLSTRKCSFCGERFPKDTLKEVSQKCGTDSSFVKSYCPSCFVDIQFDKDNKKERIRVSSQNNRTKKLGLTSDLTLKEWLEIVKKYEDKCAYCGEEWTDMEHVLPVSRGGGTTKTNVVPSCRKCNIKKARSENFVIEFAL